MKRQHSELSSLVPELKVQTEPDTGPRSSPPMAVVKSFFVQDAGYFGWSPDDTMQFLDFDAGARFEIVAQDAATVTIAYILGDGYKSENLVFARSDFEEIFGIVESTPPAAE